MDTAQVTIKELPSVSKTKVFVSNIPGNAVLQQYKGSMKKVVVVKGTAVQMKS